MTRGYIVRHFSDEDKQQAVDNLYAKATEIGLGTYKVGDYSKDIASEFGLCNTCKHVCVVKSYGKVLKAHCENLEFPLKPNFPITDCTSYKNRTQLDLDDMFGMAIMIDPPKEKAGF